MTNGENIGESPDMLPVASEHSDELKSKLDEMQKQVRHYPNTLLQFFQYAHLPAHLQIVSKPFCDLAQELEKTELGRAAVQNTKDGKIVDYGKLGGVMLASQARLNKRLSKLEEALLASKGKK